MGWKGVLLIVGVLCVSADLERAVSGEGGMQSSLIVRVVGLVTAMLFMAACTTGQPPPKKHRTGNFTANVYDNKGP